jgi:penicillin G amidase
MVRHNGQRDDPQDAALSDQTAPEEPSFRHLFRTLPRPVRWSAYVAVALVLLLVATLVVAAVLVRRPLPETEGSAPLPGLSGDVEVVRDDNGIPHLYADSDDDLMRGQGYVQAQERFFEMDVRRHVTSGRLAELFGETALETDKFIRTMGWRRVAEREWSLLEPETRAALTAYTEGVNAFLDQHGTGDIAVEYTLMTLTGLDYEPEPWTPLDSLAWLKAMAWDLRGNMEEEIDRVMASVRHTPREVAQLHPGYPYDEHPPIVEGGGVVDGVYEQDASGNSTRNPRRAPYPLGAVRVLRDARRAMGSVPALLGRGDGIGSNSWVVSGEHSATGAPLLANDPHLGTSQPGIWMQMGLHCRQEAPDCTLDVSGFTFSGVPGVIIGHNADIAWGFTNLSPDVTDLYLEQVRDSEWWLQDGKRRRMQVRTETIEVRGGEDFELRIRETAHGPLISDVSAELSTVGANAPTEVRGRRGNGYAVALRWTALDPAPTADAILALNRARDWDEFRAAAADFAVPSQNLVYADREGHIGYQAPGRIPIRKPGHDGLMPAEGWVSANDWTGDYIPFDGLPNVLDPEEGFIVTANQAVIGPEYPYHLTDDWDQGYRATRIRHLLEEEGELSIDEMTDLQLDTHNPMAAVLVPYLLDVDVPAGYYEEGQDELVGWDFDQPADSGAAAYYNAVWSNLLRLAFHDEIRPDNWPDGGDRWFSVVRSMLDEPAGPWWDDVSSEDVVETRDDILRQALMDARDEMTRRQALDPADWTWGHLHRMDLRSSTLGDSGIGIVERLVNRDGYQVGGGSSIVDATGWEAAEGYEVTSAPSMRMVVSLADLDDSRWINLTGVSGHPGSSHYDDQTELWVEGEYLPWAHSREAVEEAGEATMVLEPAAEE